MSKQKLIKKRKKKQKSKEKEPNSGMGGDDRLSDNSIKESSRKEHNPASCRRWYQ